MTFVRGKSGNRAGRPKRQIANLGLEGRRWANLALSTLVQVCQNGKPDRDHVAAANALLDRGFGRPVQSVDLIMLGKRITELSDAELIELQSRLATVSGVAAEQLAADAGEPVH
jgi:hypothetical protein